MRHFPSPQTPLSAAYPYPNYIPPHPDALSPHPPIPLLPQGEKGGRYRFRVLMLSEAPLPLRERGLG
jgi:hypothetical protein